MSRYNGRKILGIAIFIGALMALFFQGTRLAVQQRAFPVPAAAEATKLVAASEKKWVVQAPAVMDPKTETQVQILNEVLAARNDNDPRLDNELRNLGPETKRKFREIYQNLSRESRNDRGTIVFLLGRNLNEAADFEFMNEVITEQACLSLADCKAMPQALAASDEDGTESEVALSYPQAVVLESLERLVQKSVDLETHRQVENILRSGLKSQVPTIARGSENLLKKL